MVVRDGQLPVGRATRRWPRRAARRWSSGSGTGKAADGLDVASRVWLLEVAPVAPAALAGTLAQALARRGHGGAASVAGRP